jgi:hypothetical protein
MHELHDAHAASKAHAVRKKGAMKWLPFQSSFVLERMCELVKTSVCTDKGFKEVHMATVSKALFEHCGVEVISSRVYNHMININIF